MEFLDDGAARCNSSRKPVISAVRSASLRQRYPWIAEPAASLDPSALLVTTSLDRRALEHLEQGGRVWLMLAESPDKRGAAFFPAAGGALGTAVAAGGRALDGFPHEGFCDLQFYNLMNGAYPLPLDAWPREIVPIVGGIRTTAAFLAKTKDLSRVAWAIEAKAGRGRLLITTLRLREYMDDAYPEAVRMFDSLLRYAAGPDFKPETAVPDEVLGRLVSE